MSKDGVNKILLEKITSESVAQMEIESGVSVTDLRQVVNYALATNAMTTRRIPV